MRLYEARILLWALDGGERSALFSVNFLPGEVIWMLSEPCSLSGHTDEENIYIFGRELTPAAHPVNSHHPDSTIPFLIL
jgi:hypothetical protein